MRDSSMVLIIGLAACSGSQTAPRSCALTQGSEAPQAIKSHSAIDAASQSAGTGMPPGMATNEHWVGTWATALQRVEPHNNPPSPYLTNNTLRQVVHVSIGGKTIRLRLSNEYGSSALILNNVRCAQSVGGSAIRTASDKHVTFNGSVSVMLAAGQSLYSDPFEFALAPLSNLAISIHFGGVPDAVTGHPGSRTTSYLQAGDQVTSAELSSPVATDHWYVISGIEVLASLETSAVVILGDSITDGRGSTTNQNDRWPDHLTRRLQTDASIGRVGVLNQGIGGNAVVTGGLGPTALARFDRDVLGQSGVRWLILLEGVNDIGASKSAAVANELISAYEQVVHKAHLAKLAVYGVPILPFKGHSYYSTEHEAARNAVNAWIRTSGTFDAVIDMEKAVRDPSAPDALQRAFDTGDHLHLNPTGYQAMADAVDLRLFTR